MVDGVICADDGVFYIANHCVDPSELDMGHAGGATASHNTGVLTPGLGDSPEAGQSMGDHLTIRMTLEGKCGWGLWVIRKPFSTPR